MGAENNLKSNEQMNAKLIYNPKAGAARKVRIELEDVLKELQTWAIEPETCLLEEGCNLELELKSALSQGIQLFVVCGGDGTITSVSNVLAGSDAKIAIIPAGTQNNMAKSMGIPLDLPGAVAVIRTGQLVKIDVGMAVCGGLITHFMEIVSVGLISALSKSGDAIQHGNYSSIGEFVSTLVSCPSSTISLEIDGEKHIENKGYIALVTNMPYVGFHYQVGHDHCQNDGLLNVLFFSDLSKLDLLKYISGGMYIGKPEDPRIQHFQVRTVDINTNPAMPVMVDGKVIGEGLVHVEIKRKALGIFAGAAK